MRREAKIVEAAKDLETMEASAWALKHGAAMVEGWRQEVLEHAVCRAELASHRVLREVCNGAVGLIESRAAKTPELARKQLCNGSDAGTRRRAVMAAPIEFAAAYCGIRQGLRGLAASCAAMSKVSEAINGERDAAPKPSGTREKLAELSSLMARIAEGAK